MSSSPVHITMVGAVMVLTIKESLTHVTCQDLEKILNQAMSKNRNRIILDFRSVPFIDSQGLELLLTMHEKLADSGGNLKILGLNGVCRDILVATRMINFLHVFGDLQEALRGEA